MEDRLNTWSIFWLIVATGGLVGIILEHYQHLLTLMVGIIMMVVTGTEDEDNNPSY